MQRRLPATDTSEMSSNYDDVVHNGPGFRVGDLVRGKEGGEASVLGLNPIGRATSGNAVSSASMPHFSPGD